MATKKKKIQRMAKILKRTCGIPHVSAFKMAKVIEKDGASMLRFEEDLDEFIDFAWFGCCGPPFDCGDWEFRGFTGPRGDIGSRDFWAELEGLEARAREAREIQEANVERKRFLRALPRPARVVDEQAEQAEHYLSLAGVDKPAPKPAEDVDALALHYLKIAGV